MIPAIGLILALALALNLIPLLRIDVEGGAETARATIALRLRHTHLAIAAYRCGLSGSHACPYR